MSAETSQRGRSRGRGGFKSRGHGRKSNDPAQTEEPLEGELLDLKNKYPSELSMLQDVFPDWSQVDLLTGLEQRNGDLESTIEGITSGGITQFAEVKSTKDRAKSRPAKESSAVPGSSEKSSAATRGRGSVRGSTRGRPSERGRGRGRGGLATTNGTAAKESTAGVSEATPSAWDEPQAKTDTSTVAWDDTAPEQNKDVASVEKSSWGNVVTSDSVPAAASEGAKSSLIPEGQPKKSWASMFAQPKPAPVPKKASQAPTQQPPPAELVAQGVVPAQGTTQNVSKGAEPVPSAPTIEEPTAESAPELLQEDISSISELEGQTLPLPTTQPVPLTEENVEHLPDESHPPATHTVASTTGSVDPRNLTPLPGAQGPISRPPTGGYAATAARAAGGSGRSASFQRRVQEQQEAVVMPGHNAVDRAAVQFGSMGLNGEPGPDVDEDREEPETRHAPQHSPPSQPKTSLPPVPRHSEVAPQLMMPEGVPTPKQAPGLPPASQQNQQQVQNAMHQGMPHEHSQTSPYAQYGGYGPGGVQQDSLSQQKQRYDAFGQQPQQSQYDAFASQPQSSQPQGSQSGFGGLSSAGYDYAPYPTADAQRNAYNQYYGSSYGPQDVRSQVQQDAGMSQQRASSGFGAGPNDPAFGSQAPQQVGRPSFDKFTAKTDAQRRTSLGEENVQRQESSTHLSARASLLEQILVSKQMPRDSMIDSTFEEMCGTQFQRKLKALRLSNGANESHSSMLEPSQPSPIALNAKYNYQNISNQMSQQAQQSRYGESTGSGHNTPNPMMGGQQQQQSAPSQHSQQSMHQGQGHPQQGSYGGGATPGFPYGHPYYSSPYQQAYQHQFTGYGQQQVGGYGSGYPSKQSGMYGGSHSYGGMAPQSSYEQHSSSPANAGAFGQNQGAAMRSASGVSGLGNLEDYGRSSAQGQNQSSGFGGMSDPFARSTSGFGGQGGGYGQQSAGGPDDSLKPFNESKGGPSPAVGQPGRPGSAANNVQGQSAQSGLPPAQNHQSGFGGGYGGFPAQGGQYSGLGGLGTHGQGQSGMGGQGGYGGGYGSSFGQYGGYSRGGGGWGQSYGAH